LLYIALDQRRLCFSELLGALLQAPDGLLWQTDRQGPLLTCSSHRLPPCHTTYDKVAHPVSGLRDRNSCGRCLRDLLPALRAAVGLEGRPERLDRPEDPRRLEHRDLLDSLDRAVRGA